MHVPFCLTRCGYCDFNTYTATELGSGASRETYAGLAIGEVGLAGRVLGGPAGPVRRCSSAAGRRRCCRRPTWRAILDAIDEGSGWPTGPR